MELLPRIQEIFFPRISCFPCNFIVSRNGECIFLLRILLKFPQFLLPVFIHEGLLQVLFIELFIRDIDSVLRCWLRVCNLYSRVTIKKSRVWCIYTLLTLHTVAYGRSIERSGQFVVLKYVFCTDFNHCFLVVNEYTEREGKFTRIFVRFIHRRH